MRMYLTAGLPGVSLGRQRSRDDDDDFVATRDFSVAADSQYAREYRLIDWARELYSNPEVVRQIRARALGLGQGDPDPGAAPAPAPAGSAPPASPLPDTMAATAVRHRRQNTSSQYPQPSPFAPDRTPILLNPQYRDHPPQDLGPGNLALSDYGRDSMLVASSGHLAHHHAHAHHDRFNHLSTTPFNFDMDGAPPAQNPSAPSPTPADNDMHLTFTGLPLPLPLDQPISLADSATLLAANGIDMDPTMAPDLVHFPQPTTISDERVNAYARLRFDDGSYYMHTYQIILGRNIDLAHKDMRRLAKVDKLQADGHRQAAEELLNGNARRAKKKRHRRRASRSVISEKGGIVNAPMDSMPIEYQQRRQSIASHSQGSPSQANGQNDDQKPAERAPQDLIMQAFPQAPTQYEGHVVEDPHQCPLVPIHPQHITARTGAQGPKGISREHAKIFFNFAQSQFCVEVLGANGLYHEEAFFDKGDIVPLDHGDRLLIGAVNIQFYLPESTLTEDQRHRQESGSRPMSFSFENGQGELESDELISSESEGELSINPRHVYHYPLDSDVESEEMLEQEDLDDYEIPVPQTQKQSLKLKIKAPPPVPAKESKRSQKRKYREPTPEEPPAKKNRNKMKERRRSNESVQESKASKGPRDSKEKGKAPAKTPAKSPLKTDVFVDAKNQSVSSKAAVDDNGPLLRQPTESEKLAGDADGMITEELVRKHNLPASLVGTVVQKRKGPGRPPKDGIMSKRQRSLVVKQARELEKAKAAGIDPADIPIPIAKPKAPKRKESAAADENEVITPTTENGEGLSSGDKKQKSAKPHRTPSPVMCIEDYTEEQLQRPPSNYVVLIHEAISSSETKQMNLQQIYSFIERAYPWYKFKTSTTGWQSSVRHNLGQHDAFVKGDKEGKGFNWRINPDVSIEKERRKRQISPPLNHAQRQTYYPPPPNGYPTYPQPAYPFHPGMPQAMPGAPPRLPPSLNSRPRLPPSMARDGNVTAASAAPGATPHASPYASPWGGGNAAGSPPLPNQASPYPPSSSAPLGTSAGPSGQYGVLYPTTAPQTHVGQYATVGASPYSQTPPRPYPPYPMPGQQPTPISGGFPHSLVSPKGIENAVPHPSGRYPLTTHPDLIPQLEAFRKVYLDARTEPGEDKKVDNAIRACVDATVPEASLTEAEKLLLKSIRNIEGVAKHLTNTPVLKKDDQTSSMPLSTSTMAAGTAAAIAADAAKNPAITQSQSGQASMNKTMSTATSSQPPSADPSPSMHRPSVEPLTPLPGSPSTQDNTPVKRDMTAVKADGNAEV